METTYIVIQRAKYGTISISGRTSDNEETFLIKCFMVTKRLLDALIKRYPNAIVESYI
jgi:hypothetical protein